VSADEQELATLEDEESDERIGPFQQVRGLISDFISRRDWVTNAGLLFEGKRDLFLAMGFDKTLTPKMYREKYLRNGLAVFPKSHT